MILIIQLLISLSILCNQVPTLNPSEFFPELKEAKLLGKSLSSNLMGNYATLGKKVFVKCNVKNLELSDLLPVKTHYKTEQRPELIHSEIACLQRLRDNPYFPEIIAKMSIQKAHFAVLAFESSFDLRIVLNEEFHLLIKPHIAFFVAQVLTALEHVNHLGMIHVDLKDENVLIDSDGLVKLIDFGGCGTPEEVRKNGFNNFCSPCYAAPEVLDKLPDDALRSCACDWWAFGIFSYMIITGSRPFWGQTREDIKQILRREDLYPFLKLTDSNSRDLISMFLKYDPEKRVGFHKKNLDQAKNSGFFTGINWEEFARRNIKCPITFPDVYYRKL